MDERYERIYAALYTGAEWPEEYIPGGTPRFRFELWRESFAFEYRLRTIINAADERLRSVSGYRLRSDAKFMLLLNFVNMIAVPLVAHGGEIGYLDAGLEEDLNVLVQAAAERSGPGDISAHALVDALSANWTKLKLAEVRLWGATKQFE